MQDVPSAEYIETLNVSFSSKLTRNLSDDEVFPKSVIQFQGTFRSFYESNMLTTFSILAQNCKKVRSKMAKSKSSLSGG